MLSDLQTARKSPSEVVFDFSKNKKQDKFLNDVMLAIAGQSINRYFFYGGAIRGGKTSVCLTIFILLAKKYPRSRWHIMRDSFTTLEATTIPSLERFCPESATVKWNRNKSNFHLTFENGSKIFVSSESFFQDPDLNWMDGLETNGIMLEQMEGLQEKTFEKAKERTGSWYIDPMPPGLILGTFNPSQTWVKDKIFVPYTQGKLESPYYFLEALPEDNPLVTADQWAAWKTLDPVNYARYIQGNWDAIEVTNRFMTQYNPDKHASTIAKFDPRKQLHIWIDFNLNPFAVNFAHIWRDGEGEHCHVFDEADIVDGSLPKMIELIQSRYPAQIPNCRITGDYQGRKRDIAQVDNASHYLLLERGLRIRSSQIVTHSNPTHENSRSDCNYVLWNYPDFKINPETCPNTCRDMRIVQWDIEKNQIMKTNRSKTGQQADHLDCIRYGINDDPIFTWIERHSKSNRLRVVNK